MSSNPLQKAIQSGVRMNDRIADQIFAKIGNSNHPRGEVYSAYRRSRLTLKSALGENDKIAASLDVMRSLRRDVLRSAASVFDHSLTLGVEEARRQLRFYGVDVPDYEDISVTDETQTALDAVMARYDSQAAAIRALLYGEAEDEQLIGDEERTGLLAGGEIIAGLGYWSTWLLWLGFEQFISRFGGGSGLDFKKQAIAAIDQRTTDCCKRVHGQVQPFNKPFRLTGTPRFADRMQFPGFHYWCRTSVVLYLDEFEFDLPEALLKV